MISIKKIANKDYSKYVLTRDNIYVGKVFAPNAIREIPKDKYFEEFLFNRHASCNGVVCRKMLFSINEENLSNDLLFNSPNYLIKAVEPKTKTDKDIIISDYVQLEKLLVYYEFEENLTKNDIKKIYKMFFKNNKFLLEHHVNFGITKNEYKGGSYYYYSENETPFNTELFKSLEDIISCSSIPHIEEEKAKQKIKK